MTAIVIQFFGLPRVLAWRLCELLSIVDVRVISGDGMDLFGR